MIAAVLFAVMATPPNLVVADGFCGRDEVAPAFEAVERASRIRIRTSTSALFVVVETPGRNVERTIALDGGCAIAAERAALMVQRALLPLRSVRPGLELPVPPPEPAMTPYAFGAGWLVDTGRLRTGPLVFGRLGLDEWFVDLQLGLLLAEDQVVSFEAREIGLVQAWSVSADVAGQRCLPLDVIEGCARLGVGAERVAGDATGPLLFQQKTSTRVVFRLTAGLSVEFVPLRPLSVVLFSGAILRPNPATFDVDAATPNWEDPVFGVFFGLEMGFRGAAEIF